MEQLELGSQSGALAGRVAHPKHDAQARFTRFAWATVGFVLFVILFGAVVRITGSGAGCGQHWPTCNGEIAHLPRTTKTLIEYTHRLTSGLSLFAVVGLVVFGFRRFERGHPVRTWSVAALALMIVEALIGAALVRLGLVENNASSLRAVVMSLHLVNTSALMATVVLTAWTSQTGARLRLGRSLNQLTMLCGLGGVLLVSVTGAVTALGDTLYPVREAPIAVRLASDHAAGSHFLQQLRIVHPVLALCVGVLLLGAALRARDTTSPHVKRWASVVFVGTLAQLGAGVVNIWLSAPGFMQVLHLALANLVWISLVVTSAWLGQTELSTETR